MRPETGRRVQKLLAVATSVSAVFAFGCSGDSGGNGDGDGDGDGDVTPLPDGGPNDTVVGGMITGSNPTVGDFNGMFSVRIGQRSIHSYGLGRSVDAQSFTMSLPPNLPTSALNGSTVGLATPIMFEVGESASFGSLEGSDLDGIIGVSPDHMLVYRAAPFVMQYPWESEFPAGWSCGLCQRGGTGAHTLMPTSCGTLVVEMGTFSTVGACNPFDQ